MKVVIADDEPAMVETLSSYFKIKNIEVVGTANNGKEAYNLCIKLWPDYLILDIRMPKYDGFYALDRLAYEKRTPKIIVYTGNIEKEIQQNLKKIRCHLVYKPVKPGKLLEIMKNNETG